MNVPFTLLSEFSESGPAQVFVLTTRSSIGDRDDAEIDLHHLTMRRIRFRFLHQMNVINLHLLIDRLAHIVDG